MTRDPEPRAICAVRSEQLSATINDPFRLMGLAEQRLDRPGDRLLLVVRRDDDHDLFGLDLRGAVVHPVHRQRGAVEQLRQLGTETAGAAL